MYSVRPLYFWYYGSGRSVNFMSYKRVKCRQSLIVMMRMATLGGALAARVRLSATFTLWSRSRPLRRFIFAAGALLATLIAAMPAMAATQSVQIEVSATVEALAEFTVTPAVFNETELVGAGGATTMASLNLNLANGTSAMIELDQGSHPESASNDAIPMRRMSGPSGYLPYQIYKDSGFTQIWGSSSSALHLVGTGTRKTVQLYILTVPATPPRAGRYSDTVRIGITY